MGHRAGLDAVAKIENPTSCWETKLGRPARGLDTVITLVVRRCWELLALSSGRFCDVFAEMRGVITMQHCSLVRSKPFLVYRIL